jgi:hypothetical protein
MSSPSLPEEDRIDDFHVQCEWKECGEIFSDLSLLVAHLNDKHIGFKKGEYICHWAGCPRSGVSQSTRFSLIAHMYVVRQVFLLP